MKRIVGLILCLFVLFSVCLLTPAYSQVGVGIRMRELFPIFGGGSYNRRFSIFPHYATAQISNGSSKYPIRIIPSDGGELAQLSGGFNCGGGQGGIIAGPQGVCTFSYKTHVVGLNTQASYSVSALCSDGSIPSKGNFVRQVRVHFYVNYNNVVSNQYGQVVNFSERELDKACDGNQSSPGQQAQELHSLGQVSPRYKNPPIGQYGGK